MAQDLGLALAGDARILDFGCGYGDVVREFRARGFDTDGVDIVPFWAEAKERYCEERELVPEALRSRLHLADHNPYHLPFADNSFDLVVSSQVFEHVMDYPAAMSELGRVLKPQGVSIHIFPARWGPIELHVFVPLATVVRGRPWLAFWALLGIRNQFQRGLPWREVLERNRRYLLEETNYPTHSMIRRWASEARVRVRFEPALFLAHHTGRTGRVARRIPLPGVSLLYETIGQRTMILWKA
jgi:SAM-dependent methyltransferase